MMMMMIMLMSQRNGHIHAHPLTRYTSPYTDIHEWNNISYCHHLRNIFSNLQIFLQSLTIYQFLTVMSSFGLILVCFANVSSTVLFWFLPGTRTSRTPVSTFLTISKGRTTRMTGIPVSYLVMIDFFKMNRDFRRNASYSNLSIVCMLGIWSSVFETYRRETAKR